MSDSTLALQAAVVAALGADVGVQALVAGRIYDRARADVAFPYVSVGPSQAEPWDTDDTTGWEVFLQLDVWSRERGGAVECRQVMQAIHDALHRAELTVTGHDFVLGRLDSARTLDDPDGVTTHGVMRFRFVTD